MPIGYSENSCSPSYSRRVQFARLNSLHNMEEVAKIAWVILFSVNQLKIVAMCLKKRYIHVYTSWSASFERECCKRIFYQFLYVAFLTIKRLQLYLIS